MDKGKTFQCHMSGDQFIEENKDEEDEREEWKWWCQFECEENKKGLEQQ